MKVGKTLKRGCFSVLICFFAAAILAASVYQVDPDEVGVVLRLGRYVGSNSPPGVHFRLPGIDRVYIVPVQRQFVEEFGFRTLGKEVPDVSNCCIKAT